MEFKNLLIIFIACWVSACSADRMETQESGAGTDDSIPANAAPGIIMIKIDRQYEDNIGALDLSALGPCTVRPSIPSGGKFEARHREAGLNLWYTVQFSRNLPLTKAGPELEKIPGIDKISYIETSINCTESPFDDPFFSLQWDLYNSGDLSGTVPGSDINILPAWEITRGSEDVIVAICDSGLDYGHEDLAGNIWTNEAEANGEPGSDDDGNGYTDDIYGWNFVTMDNVNPVGATIIPGDHGTHIAGTIAAVSNNGTGISGIAGGDSPEGNGVRLMSIQTSHEDYPAFIGEAIVYAADNGAVIMNCSWAVESDSDFINEAIDYFNAYAGFDENGNQTGPVAGGLCIFAAGNESATFSYPAMNDNVIAVASTGPDYTLAYYSNYGEWVDISAPGGDARKEYQIYSTLTRGSGSYGYMQGTSMACPHAAGVAALIASRYGGPGFTGGQLKNILLGSADPVIYSYNPAYTGMLGAGLLDAGAAVSRENNPPLPVEDMQAEAESNTVILSWTAPEDVNGDTPYSYDIYYSENSLADLDPDSPGEAVTHLVFIPENDASGRLEYRIDRLEFDTEYHFRLRSRNLFNQYSELTAQISCSTTDNNLPSITAIDGNSLTLRSHETGALHFRIEDADGHDITYSVTPADGTDALDGLRVSHTQDGIVTLTIYALEATEGMTYNGILSATDSYSTSEEAFSYTIGKNSSPEVSGQIDGIVFNSRTENTSIDLSGVFSDRDMENLEYGYSVSTEAIIVRCSISGETLDLEANSYGQTEVTVTATDGRGESASVTFTVIVRDGTREIDLYPNPVEDILNVRTGADVNAGITVSNKAGAAVFSLENAAISPFDPVQIDLGGLPGGIYYVRVKGDGIDASYPVIKQ